MCLDISCMWALCVSIFFTLYSIPKTPSFALDERCPARLMYPHLFRVLYLLVSDEVLSPCYSQISRCGSNQATNIRRHADHLKSLAYTSPRSLPITTENTECNVIF